MSLASGSQLAQVRPGGTSAASAFTADLNTEITLIVVCNTTGSPAAFSVYHDDTGATFDATTALHFAQEIPANSSIYVTSESPGSGLQVTPGGQIGIQTDTANALTFTVYGETEKVAGA